jgi:hypothetical protein
MGISRSKFLIYSPGRVLPLIDFDNGMTSSLIPSARPQNLSPQAEQCIYMTRPQRIKTERKAKGWIPHIYIIKLNDTSLKPRATLYDRSLLPACAYLRIDAFLRPGLLTFPRIRSSTLYL